MHNIIIGSVVRINSNTGKPNRLYGIVSSVGDYWITLKGSTALYKHNALTLVIGNNTPIEQKENVLNSLKNDNGLLIITMDNTQHTTLKTIADINTVLFVQTNKVQIVL